jgi:hypothetical protein
VKEDELASYPGEGVVVSSITPRGRTMFAYTLAVCLSPGAPVPPPKSRPVYVYSTLTVEQAEALAGKLVRVRANIADPDPEYAENENADGNLRGIVWRRGEATVDDGEMVIEGRLTVRYVPSYVINGQYVEGFYRFRLEAARPIRDREDD